MRESKRVLEKKRERKKVSVGKREIVRYVYVCVCVCVCVSMYVCVCVYEFVSERERGRVRE